MTNITLKRFVKIKYYCLVHEVFILLDRKKI